MKFGIDLPNFGDYANVRLVAEIAHEAEEAGWDGFFVWDHIGANWGTLSISDPWILLTAIALRTEHLLLGPMVTPLARRRPWKVSREVVTLDHVSGGRVLLGVGLGEGSEYSSYHEPGDDREHAEMLDEALDILTRLWRGEPLNYNGKHYHIDDVLYLPRPLQQPRIPIWVAGRWPNKKPMHRAARWDGAIPIPRTNDPNKQLTPAELASCLAFIRSQQTAESANKPYDLVYAGHLTYKDRDADEAIVASYAAAGVTWWLECPKINDTLADMRQRIRLGPPTMR